MALTDTAIRNAKPKEKLYRIADSNGLCLEITPSGSKLWRYRYRYKRKARMLSLGAYPSVTLFDARRKRDEARSILTSGIDPSEHRREASNKKRQASETFTNLAEEWYTYNAPRWADSTKVKARAYLDKDILPVIGSRAVKDITRPDLVGLVRKVEERGALNVATKVRQWLGQIFRHGLAAGIVDTNPATDLSIVAAPPQATRHHPYVPFAELPELLSKVDKAKIHLLTRYSIHLLVLTAVRPAELRLASWSEFNLNTAIWTIPKERMKARRPHVVPLPTQAIEILRKLQKFSGQYELLFPGKVDVRRPISENTVNKALHIMGYKGRQTGHGFRHLLSTELNTKGYNRDWIERQLAHADDNSIRDTYNHAEYLEQRRTMMQEWADSITKKSKRANYEE